MLWDGVFVDTCITLCNIQVLFIRGIWSFSEDVEALHFTYGVINSILVFLKDI